MTITMFKTIIVSFLFGVLVAAALVNNMILNDIYVKLLVIERSINEGSK